MKDLVWRLNDLLLRDCRAHCHQEGLRVREAGGLHVVGTAIRESRRIDNQVRGIPVALCGYSTLLMTYVQGEDSFFHQ